MDSLVFNIKLRLVHTVIGQRFGDGSPSRPMSDRVMPLEEIFGNDAKSSCWRLAVSSKQVARSANKFSKLDKLII